MVDQALAVTKGDGYGVAGDAVVIVAGLPFGVAGSTNTLRIATVS